MLNDTKTSLFMTAIVSQLFDEYDDDALRSPSVRPLVGELIAVQTFCSAMVFVSHEFDIDDADDIVDFLKRTKLRVEVDKRGKITTTSEVEPRPWFRPCSLEIPSQEKKAKTVTVESTDGKTVYIIQNLNIFINANVVEQLNVNPQEVINNIHEQIEDAIKKLNENEDARINE